MLIHEMTEDECREALTRSSFGRDRWTSVIVVGRYQELVRMQIDKITGHRATPRVQ
jgi:hypothetical protein